MSLEFGDQTVIVTGAGGGLGRQYALEFARRGAAVVVNDAGGSVAGAGGSDVPASRVVEEIVANGGRAVASLDSIATPEGGAAVVDAAIAAFGRVDVVVHNAGILRDKSLVKLDWADLDAVLDVHLRGAFYVSKPAFIHMKDSKYGRFVFTSSNAGVFGNFGQSNYGAAKAGLVGLSNVLAIEGAKSGITSNVIMPVARTRMTEDLLGHFADQVAPELVTPMVVFLASAACELTHECFSAVGGRYARVFTGLTQGWYAGKGVVPSAEDILVHLDEIENRDGYTVPLSTADELTALLPLLAQE
ncbi:SDR family NAD(P)-dependent oxidoreductase [Rhodococcus sp. G-MC3]|uniref:SDR family NAD(P)-dependent oxidoreductase n=1 Tax=Rhodococcus sp. G-MC3 TaxID=3046209 RepID=UPI0024B9813D|nr:SDR family NAD(P)-dependent oxidoreductase [Rhodococcus sp. G-MC3]MDJ0392648.1 SDR family NAD(P)-dependent oxidoreductase [Rhodococcus sp. G-MC3]